MRQRDMTPQKEDCYLVSPGHLNNLCLCALETFAEFSYYEWKFPSSPATAKITKVGLQLHFGWAHAHPGNRLSNLKILARYL